MSALTALRPRGGLAIIRTEPHPPPPSPHDRPRSPRIPAPLAHRGERRRARPVALRARRVQSRERAPRWRSALRTVRELREADSERGLAGADDPARIPVHSPQPEPAAAAQWWRDGPQRVRRDG